MGTVLLFIFLLLFLAFWIGLVTPRLVLPFSKTPNRKTVAALYLPLAFLAALIGSKVDPVKPQQGQSQVTVNSNIEIAPATDQVIRATDPDLNDQQIQACIKFGVSVIQAQDKDPDSITHKTFYNQWQKAGCFTSKHPDPLEWALEAGVGKDRKTP